MTKELSKQIMGKSKSKNVYFKWPLRENFSTYKNEKKNKKKNKQANATTLPNMLKKCFRKLTAKKVSKSF